MIKGIGTDLVRVERILKAADNERFMQRVFTEEENVFFASRGYPAETIAGNFAVKESIVKALGTTYNWREVSVLRDPNGKPIAAVKGALLEQFKKEKLKLHVTITHEGEYASAVAILESEK